ncbi:MAG: malto-oligosyltrehalose synthase, partial [Chloroflexi bacterium]|nr:malto-oligosyltrehalose synthase [Chloroflexota bacterium]
FGVSVAAFHRNNAERSRRWPHSLLATSTPDTSRGEDVRARISVLSEIPEEWQAALTRWSALNAPKKTAVDGEPTPHPNDEYLLYQTLIGAWPASSRSDHAQLSSEELAEFRGRILAYMTKATKEAKVRTSWVNPNAEYDAAVQRFVLAVLADGDDNRFLSDLRAFQRRVAYFGRFNALAQVLLKLTSPGVPDLYQGTELWDLSLVDPDNRRPVDYRRRSALLAELKDDIARAGQDLTGLARDLLANAEDGRIKLYLIHRTLRFRRACEPLFTSGTYRPLEARGAQEDHVCAFARALGEETILVVVPRLVVGLAAGAERPPMGPDVWQDTRLALPDEPAGRRYRNLFTGEVLAVDARDGESGLSLAAVLAHFPVALLEHVGE